MKNREKYELVIGLEVHAQLLSKSKLFCGDPIAFGAEPNTQVSPISLAHPGTLPVMNSAVLELAVQLGLAVNCNITQHNYFARKNYFYPDLPKGYQVSQDTAPICREGFLEIKTAEGSKKVLLNRIHMEEDAGKSIHDLEEDFTCVDLNRAGTPLLEIVTEPCLHSSDEAFSFLTELRKLVRWIGVCDGNMEEGSMRCDANISIRLVGDKKLGTRVEVKNLNSIRNVKRAIEFEADRLIDIVEKGEVVQQQTRSFDADKGITFSLRTKEDADDYRYFPEPDLPPFFITDEHIESIRSGMPPLPATLEASLINDYSLSGYDAAALCSDKAEADFYFKLLSHNAAPKAAANWMLGPVRATCNEQKWEIADLPLTAEQLAALINFTETGKVSFNIATSRLFPAMISNGYQDPEMLAETMNLLQESDESAIIGWVDEVLASMPHKVKEYRSGKKNLAGLFAGQVKKLSKGKADMHLVNKILEQQLNKV
ncbi:MAG: Asp-tRNA(Asn)/Glu-tRNA(Gln) amidotransferase subunit GatB [Chitinophagaceae bacterium]|nr:MAG: Asp-tRNA(Asn)/Glu-tRNA(Gln) amidotransferase subunit GatB [Chitinophagaceae bacterium]